MRLGESLVGDLSTALVQWKNEEDGADLALSLMAALNNIFVGVSTIGERSAGLIGLKLVDLMRDSRGGTDLYCRAIDLAARMVQEGILADSKIIGKMYKAVFSSPDPQGYTDMPTIAATALSKLVAALARTAPLLAPDCKEILNVLAGLVSHRDSSSAAVLPSSSIIGNVAICLSALVDHRDLEEDFFGAVIQLGLINSLLDAAHKYTGAAQRNCAIALAKLASKSAECRARLKELHGFEILYSYVKPNSQS